MEKGDVEVAERMFREALEHDVCSPSAHNNLGITLMRQSRYYEAAWEFEYAAKLTPRALEPRANLALLYEKLGRLDRAAGEYEAALEIDPKDLTSMQHLARTYVKAGGEDERLVKLLRKLLLIPLDRQWDYWVRGQLIRLDRHEAPTD